MTIPEYFYVYTYYKAGVNLARFAFFDEIPLIMHKRNWSWEYPQFCSVLTYASLKCDGVFFVKQGLFQSAELEWVWDFY